MQAVGHDQGQWHRRHRQLLHRETRLDQQRDERAAREEAQVGAVEDAAVGVLEAPREELQAHPQVGDIGNRGDDEAVGGEGPVERDEGGERIAQMLEHIAVHDRVEGAGQGLRCLVEVGDHHLRAPAARPLGLGGIALERSHPPSLPGQELRQEAVGGAHVEESAAASRPEPVEDDRVARVRVALEPIG